MTKQALLENVLDMWLTQKQIESIKTGWKAFYVNPMQYKNSVVIDMKDDYGLLRYDSKDERILKKAKTSKNIQPHTTVFSPFL